MTVAPKAPKRQQRTNGTKTNTDTHTQFQLGADHGGASPGSSHTAQLEDLPEQHGNFKLLRTDNCLEIVNGLTNALLLEFDIARELTVLDGGQKRNVKIERRVGQNRHGGRAAFKKAVRLFPGVECPTRAFNLELI